MSEAREYQFGATTDLCAEWPERDSGAFTISSATVTVESDTGVVLRNAVAATVDNASAPPRSFYLETFSTANGYVAGESYTVTFRATMSTGHIPAWTYSIIIMPTAG